MKKRRITQLKIIALFAAILIVAIGVFYGIYQIGVLRINYFAPTHNKDLKEGAWYMIHFKLFVFIIFFGSIVLFWIGSIIKRRIDKQKKMSKQV